jgi:hypothetical protein
MDEDIHMARGKPAFKAYMMAQNFTEDTDPRLIMIAWGKCARPQYLTSLELVVVHGLKWEAVLNSHMSWEDATGHLRDYRMIMDDEADAARARLNGIAPAPPAPPGPPTPPTAARQQQQHPAPAGPPAMVLNLAVGGR